MIDLFGQVIHLTEVGMTVQQDIPECERVARARFVKLLCVGERFLELNVCVG